ncbi:DAK2 domain protein [Candidatus Izimaplasma bacterium HR1]|uniref:DAK2 domain-containing protein n=1 Tax=Candidatus Izimoplasma sp. HR1 TaxID=1541959 RepID=UPI0004F7DF8B|nr:DAK2 domain protein [Candidatus Izimaplasma bacterium HR1]
MNPTVIDGNLMKLLITNGTIALRNDHQRINELNVFPVPDGDTGSNMQSTMMSGVKAISALENESVEKVAKVLSRGLLMGARGNSGVILSQLFSGFAKVFKGKTTATVSEFTEGFVQGVKQAYSAVINPVEGTILTVAREAADKAVNDVNEETGLLDIMNVYVKEAYESLDRTPDLLQVLKDAGVIDSGGAGFNVIIDGMILALEGEILEDSKFATVPSVAQEIGMYDGGEDFGYCTEFIVQLKDGDKFNKEKFTKRISRFGDSLVVVADEEICKVHIHTQTPGDVLNFGQQYGNFATLKIENMTLQHSETLLHAEQDGHDCGHEHAHYEKPKTKYGIITVVNGEGLQNTFKEMGVSCVIDGGQTMNPSTEDFINAVENLNCDHVIIIPNNGNVLLSAQHAAKYMEERSVSVLPAKTIAQGYASLTMFDANQELEVNIAEMEDLIKNVKTGEVTYAVRDTEYKGVEIKKDQWMGIANGEIISSTEDRLSAVCKLMETLVDEDSEIVTVIYGNNVDEKELEKLMLSVDTHYPDVEIEVIEGNQNIYSYILAVE